MFVCGNHPYIVCSVQLLLFFLDLPIQVFPLNLTLTPSEQNGTELQQV